ncbi:non-ribosomal peptide synthetase [Mycobacterium sp. 141]|uniref:non-ribosomal peptide synthetase n=1 Tax=Mycobacterium sp. 141 TaxID=1120797 RepID=UPI00037F51A8|nr:non-ribosomal peptide synthetase [Mycobacterium sp. 141]
MTNSGATQAVAQAAGSTVPDVLAEWVKLRPHVVALRNVSEQGVEEMTYQQLWDRANRIRDKAFADLVRGSRVPMLMPGGIDYVAGFFAALIAGLVPVPVYLPSMRAPERFLARAQSILRDCEPGAVYTCSDIVDVIERDHVLGRLSVRTPDSVIGGSVPNRQQAISANDAAFLQYSSGSTGNPKGIINTHASILRQAAIGLRAWNRPDDVHTVSWLPLYHDMGIIWGALMPLLNGGTATLIPPHEFVRNPRIWLETVSSTRGNWISGPDFAYRRCIDAFDDRSIETLNLDSLRLATNGAEPIRSSTLRAFGSKFRSAGLRDDAIAPQYGLAEAGLGVSGSDGPRPWVETHFDANKLERGRALEVTTSEAAERRSRTLVSCGDSTYGWDVRIVDPVAHTFLGEGKVGEIWLSGPGLPEGYWRRPEETDEIFHATTREGTGPYLRTGDAGFTHQGELYICGRYRDLILVGGTNHFPNDIESTAETAACGVAPGGACAIQPEHGQAEDAWWLVVETESSPEDLGDFSRVLRRRVLANHQTAPDRIVWVAPRSLPTTTSGKIRRRETLNRLVAGEFDILYEFRSSSQSPAIGVAPQDSSGSVLAKTVADLLAVHVEDLSPDTDLVALGLTSVMTAQIVNWAYSQSRYLDFADLYADPTLRGWQRLFDSALMDETGDSGWASPDVGTATALQRAYWVGRGAEQPLGGVGCQTYFELAGVRLDASRLERALDVMASRHPMLRARFPEAGRFVVDANIHQEPLRVHDLVEADETTCDTHLEEVRYRLRTHRFDIETGDTWTVELSRFPSHSVLHFAVDLIATDLTGIGILLRDLAAIYRGDREVSSQRSLRTRVVRTSSLADVQVESLVEGPQLPQVEEPEISFRRHQHTLTAATLREIDDACHAHGVTRAAAFLAIYTLILRRWSSSEDFVVNVTTFGRAPENADLIGDFTKTHLLRAPSSRGQTLVDYVRSVQRSLRDALQGPESTDLLGAALRAGTGHSGIVPVVFTYAADDPILTACETDTLGRVSHVRSTTPQVLIDNQACMIDDDVVLSWDYRAGCFPDGVVDDMFEAYVAQLNCLRRRDWGTPISIDLSAHSHQIRNQRNATTMPAESGLLYDGFLQIAKSSPNRVAVRWHPDEYSSADDKDPIAGPRADLTYGTLADLGGRVAAAVAERHQPGSVVGIQLAKGPAQIVAVLGVMMAGCAYLPLAIDQPPERLRAICAKAGVSGLLRVDDNAAVAGVVVHELSAMTSYEVALPRGVDPDDPAYVIYTSGSTGEPKGVVISHGAALNTITDINRRNMISADDSILAVSALDFDLSVYDIFGPLNCGATIVTISEDSRRDAFHWASLITEFGITTWNSVPGLMDMLLVATSHEPPALSSLRSVFLSGDWIPLDMPGRLQRAAPRARLVAMGGATEAAIWSNEFIVEDLDPTWTSVPYGYPLANQMFRVVDAEGHDCPDYVAGELWIGGAGVALGYHNAPDLTAERFRRDAAGVRWYRTGDLGCYWRDGTLQFLGRADSQVKIRGHRVECGEIEHTLRRHPLVESAVVTPILDRTALGAAVVPSAGAVPDGAVPSGADFHDELRSYLIERLPQYMVPKAYISCDRLPVNVNGKVDRVRAAADVEAAVRVSLAHGAELGLTEIEQVVAEVWSDVLGVSITTRDDNFFAHGGDSLRATEVVSRLRRKGLVGAEVGHLLSHQTLAQFSVTCAIGSTCEDVVVDFEPGEPTDEFPLTRLQQAYALGASGLNGTTRAPTYFSIVLSVAADSPAIELDRFTRVLDGCVEEFAMLRCALASDTTQIVHPGPRPITVHLLDSEHDDPDALLRHLSRARFDPYSVPVIQCFAPSRSPRNIGLLISYLGLDARSLSTVVTTIIADYEQRDRPRPIDPSASVFTRFVDDSRRSVAAAESDADGPPMLPLREDRPDSSTRAFFVRRSFTLDEHDAAALRNRAVQLNVTPTALIFETFIRALHSIGAGERFAVTVPRSHRPDYAPVDREVLGNFTRLALCGVDYVAVQPGSTEALAVAQEQLWHAIGQDDDATGDLAVSRSMGGYPVVFTSTIGLSRQNPNGLRCTRALTQTPGVWLDCQVEDDAAGIRLSWDVAVDVLAEAPLATAFSTFEVEVRRYTGRVDRSPTPPSRIEPPAESDWASAVIARAVHNCASERVLPRYASLVKCWQALPCSASEPNDPEVERAAIRLVDIVTGAVSSQTLIGDPRLAPEAMLLADGRTRAALDGLTERVFTHARTVGRRLRVMEVGSRTGLITQYLTEAVGPVVEEYLCLEPSPVLAEMARERSVSVPTRHLERVSDDEIDVVICCGSLHQLSGVGTMLDDISMSGGGWLWVLENTDIAPATLVSAAVLDPGLVSPESEVLRPADQWWRLLADHGWKPAQMVQDGTGVTVLAHRPRGVRHRGGNPRRTTDLRPPWPEQPVAADAKTIATIAEVWQRHLPIDEPGADADFFLLGGDSLVATRVYADLRAAGFNRLAFVDLFNYSTLGALAAHAGPPTAALPPAAGRPAQTADHDPARFPLTVVQNAYRAGRGAELVLGGVAAHCYFEFELAAFDSERFASAAYELVNRHPGLRTTVSRGSAESSTECAVVHPMPIEPVVRRYQDVRAAMRNQVLDLNIRSGIDFGVQELTGGRALVGISMDNTMLDGASMMIALAELDHLYRGGRVDELPDLTASFADYVRCRPELSPGADEVELPQLAASRDYWRARLASLPQAPRVTQFSTLLDIEQPRFERATETIERATWSEITRLCRGEGVTVASFLLTAYAVTLAQWSGTDHFCINVTLFDRDPEIPGIEHVIGDFTSLVLLECRVDESISIWKQARRIQQQLMTDLPHRGADAVWLQRELLRHHGRPDAALFPVVFTSGLGLIDTATRTAPQFGQPAYAASQTPQTILDFQVWESAGALRLSWDYVAQAVPSAQARAGLARLVNVISGVVEHNDAATTDPPVGEETMVQHVSRICAEALGRSHVGPDDNFFQLGGDSAAATRVVEQISRQLSASATLRMLFANPVIGEFAAKLDRVQHIEVGDGPVEEGVL